MAPERGDTVSDRLRICRQAKGLSKAEAARKIGIEPASLGQLESGSSKQPAASTLLDMRDRLGYDPDYVIRGRGMPLLPNFEELARESALIAIFRELRPETKKALMRVAQDFRRAQGGGPSPNDPFETDTPDE